MKPTRRLAVALGLLLSLIVLLSGCVQERIVYVPVTVTPDGVTASAGDAGEGATVPLPPDSGDAASTPATTPATPVPTAASNADASGAGGDAEPETTVSTAPAAEASTALPAPETGRLAFMGPYGQSGTMQAFVVNGDGSGLTMVSESLGEGYFPSLSPDGSRVAFVANTTVDPDIYVADVATGEATNLTEKPGFDNQPVWSPDGTQIAFVTDREGGDVDIWVMGADGSDPSRIARTPGEETLGSWSPDGTRLVYSSADELGESLWIIDVATGETTRLTEAQATQHTGAAWSPDGERIAFYVTEQGAMPELNTIRPDGSDRQRIDTGTDPAVFPAWSPDGQWLVYTQLSGERRNLVALNLETNQVQPLPEVQGFATSWRPAETLLADTGFTQGPRQTGVEVAPAVLETAFRKGDPNAPVTIVEFSDYQCPFCQRWFNESYPRLQEYIDNGTVQLIFVDFPLNIHPQAPAAHRAARCAAELGGEEAYWAMHDALFQSLGQWSGQEPTAPIFNRVAAGVGLDGSALQSCVESGRYSEIVEAGLNEGMRLGVSGTPTFFINGDRLVGAQPWEAFVPYINAAEAGQ